MKVKVFKTSFSFLKNQCYLAHSEGRGVLIDPAWDFGTIDEYITAHDIALRAVLVTHAHTDHTDLAGRFAKRYGCPVCMSSIEIEHSGFQCQNLTATYDLEMIDIGGLKVMPLLTPGHTIGGMCYILEGHIFTGDTIFIEGVGSCGSNEEHASMLFDSVQKIKDRVDMDTKFWPGHSFGQQPGENLRFLLDYNIYFQIRDRSHFIKFRTRRNRPDPFGFE